MQEAVPVEQTRRDSGQREKEETSTKPYTASDVKLLRRHSKARTPVSKIAKLMRRSEGSLRQKALTLGIGLGHLRWL
jgi:hypothetical protein